MKLPGFMFYPGDWLKDADLRRCSHAAKGVWTDMLCLMFECEERGVLATAGRAWSDDEIAQAVGGDKLITLSCIIELVEKRVASRNHSNAVYSRRMVREEKERKANAQRQQQYRSRDGPQQGNKSNVSVTGKVTPLSVHENESEKEASSVERGGAGGENRSGIPTTEQEAVEWAAMENVPGDFAVEVFTQKEATVWENGNHAPITNWRKYIKARWSKMQTAKASFASKPHSIMDLKSIIAAKQTQANQIKNQYCSEVAMGDSWSDMAKKKEWRQLCAEIWKLNDKIAHSA